MEKQEVVKSIFRVCCAALAGAVFSLFCLSVFAIIVQAYALPQAAVTAVLWTVKCLSAFLSCLLFLGGERALFKGMGAGVLYSILTMLLFAAIGGGFGLGGFFALELLVSAILGGCGALVGAKLRKA